MRKYRDTPAPQGITPQKRNDMVTQVRAYRLITPMFGGGVEPARIDEVTVIRGSEIRGQLRFWWRACRGGQFGGDCKKMKQVEDFIWGKAYKKGDKPEEHQDIVQIAVEATDSGEAKHLYPFGMLQPNLERQHQPTRDVPRVLQYAAFPLREKKQAVFDGISFTLTITFPCEKRLGEEVIQVANEVKAALWAWETFGGIGARTRRGFGALRCVHIKENGQPQDVQYPPASPEGVIDWINDHLKEYVKGTQWWPQVTHLPKSLIEGRNAAAVKDGNPQSAFQIWGKLIQKLKDFRQARFLKPNQGNPRWPGNVRENRKQPGRSMWPEPSTIRNRTRQSSKYHRRPIPDPPIYRFPRAYFGLPIIFQFKHADEKVPDREDADPRKTMLSLREYERFASPLILKPLACEGGKAFVGLALVLEGPKLDEQSMMLQAQEGTREKWEQGIQARLAAKEAFRIEPENSSPIRIDAHTDILQIFLRYLQGDKKR